MLPRGVRRQPKGVGGGSGVSENLGARKTAKPIDSWASPVTSGDSERLMGVGLIFDSAPGLQCNFKLALGAKILEAERGEKAGFLSLLPILTAGWSAVRRRVLGVICGVRSMVSTPANWPVALRAEPAGVLIQYFRGAP